MLDNLFCCISEPGDAVLLPRPYYAVFEFDVQCKAGSTIVGVETVGVQPEVKGVERYYPTLKGLEKARDSALQQGLNPKVLLICQPNNPISVCYPKHVMELVWEFAEKHGMHLVSDEIYGAGIHAKQADFWSISRLAADKGRTLGDYVHVIYALSKDFASSGLRCGMMYSENQQVLKSMRKLNDLCQISSHTQWGLSRVFSDTEWIEDFLSKANSRLNDRFKLVKKSLEPEGVKVIEAEAGLFCWLDCRSWLEENTWDAEKKLYQQFFDEAKVLLTPGYSMRTEQPGYFRCCFATHEEVFNEGMKRLKDFGADKLRIEELEEESDDWQTGKYGKFPTTT
uniref:Aminotransferase class I/classII large domain-containing protein n=1 Tax=Amorphochlora amoebiformis TaxID=1561963 RepID=A0A7S0H9A1_9EUKA